MDSPKLQISKMYSSDLVSAENATYQIALSPRYVARSFFHDIRSARKKIIYIYMYIKKGVTISSTCFAISSTLALATRT